MFGFKKEVGLNFPEFVEINGNIMSIAGTNVTLESVHRAAFRIDPCLLHAEPYLDGNTVKFRNIGKPSECKHMYQPFDDPEPVKQTRELSGELRAHTCKACGAKLNENLLCEYCKTQYHPI